MRESVFVPPFIKSIYEKQQEIESKKIKKTIFGANKLPPIDLNEINYVKKLDGKPIIKQNYRNIYLSSYNRSTWLKLKLLRRMWGK